MGIHVGTARLAGKHGHLAGQIIGLKLGDLVKLAVFFNINGEAPLLNNVESIPGIALANQPLAFVKFDLGETV